MRSRKPAWGSEELTELATALAHGQGPVSGQMLADRFGISRAALQKRIQKLRNLGFDIPARPRKGYHLAAKPDRLLAETIAVHLETRWLGHPIAAHEICDSTNDEALKAALTGASAGMVVTAETQRAGRGRMGRHWHSPPASNIHMSALLKPPLPPPRMGLLTLASALSVAEAVHSVCELTPQLKWPNDLMLDGRKTCGILTEMSGDAEAVRWLVVGIGCNVNSDDFPPELASTATSLKLKANRPVDRVRLAAEILNRLEAWHDRYVEKGPPPVLDAWRDWPNILDSRVTVTQPVTGERLEGVARDLDQDGALLLELQDGRVERIISGDVTAD